MQTGLNILAMSIPGFDPEKTLRPEDGVEIPT
jgi:hypothetical protein